ncbi:MAG TPA: hypothetical protein PK264_13100 [Hyphomicrobiaceae bacterium]|nr:hypothetical protein [Hyphomicrobiaceae bacterium]
MDDPLKVTPAQPDRPRARRWGARLLIRLFLMVLAIEGLSYALLRFGPQALIQTVYHPPVIGRAAFETFMAERHPILSWPTRGRDGRDREIPLDERGARTSMTNVVFSNGDTCLSAYGDGAVRADGVADHHAWSDLLARRLACRVDNFGISGYGADQAVLRLLLNPADAAKAMVLGVSPAALLRMGSQWPFLLDGPSAGLAILTDMTGRLDLVPAHDLTYEGFLGLARDPALYLGHERYLPGSPYGPEPFAFPYSASLARVGIRFWRTLEPGRMLAGAPMRLWRHPSWFEGASGPAPELLARSDRLIGIFHRACTARGARCAVLVLPDVRSLFEIQTSGRNLLEVIYRRLPPPMTVWDPLPELSAAMAEKGVCHYVGNGRDCRGHFNADGNRLIADFIARQLARLTGAP